MTDTTMRVKLIRAFSDAVALPIPQEILDELEWPDDATVEIDIVVTRQGIPSHLVITRADK